jgi:hypothetical protein
MKPVPEGRCRRFFVENPRASRASGRRLSTLRSEVWVLLFWPSSTARRDWRGRSGKYGPGSLIQRCTAHKLGKLEGKAPVRMREELKEDYRRMIYGETAAELAQARARFLKKWRLACSPVAASLEEAGDELFTFLKLSKSQWKACARPTRSSASTSSPARGSTSIPGTDSGGMLAPSWASAKRGAVDGTPHHGRWTMSTATVVVASAAPILGCASYGPATRVAVRDVKSVAGTWKGIVYRFPDAVGNFAHLGYPQYVRIVLGVAKALGVVALLWPGTALLKEWAYAGFGFVWIGAFVAHTLARDGKSRRDSSRTRSGDEPWRRAI